ncbi:dihydrofolate reductase family protein [Bauldia sp.]|uniref:dihydrofolate reductase family protein n=1 Tax=Bauldia sp. TaxID=2575872 RepID=UPI003BAD7D42
MRDLAILTFQTLDGVIQGPSTPDEDRSGGFDLGGWAAPFWELVMDQVRVEAMADPYDMLFGRKTYDMFAAYWSNADESDPAAQRMNAASKFVVTRSATPDLPWQNSTAIQTDVPAEVARLKAMNGPLLQIHGSGALIQTLLAHDLIDEMRLWTFPLVLGTGKRLFAGGSRPTAFTLVKTAPTGNGVVMSKYRRQTE